MNFNILCFACAICKINFPRNIKDKFCATDNTRDPFNAPTF